MKCFKKKKKRYIHGFKPKEERLKMSLCSMLPEYNSESLGPIYTKRQCQCCSDACDFILIEISGVV